MNHRLTLFNEKEAGCSERDHVYKCSLRLQCRVKLRCVEENKRISRPEFTFIFSSARRAKKGKKSLLARDLLSCVEKLIVSADKHSQSALKGNRKILV